MLSVNPSLTPAEVKSIIQQTADPIVDEHLYPGQIGAGRINACRAVEMAFISSGFYTPNFIHITLKVGSKLDTIASYESSFCDDVPIAPFNPTDTITYKDKTGKENCLKDNMDNTIYFPGNMPEIADAVWTINGDTVANNTRKDSIGYYFNLNDFDHLWKNTNYPDEHIIVKVKLNDTSELVFSFRVRNDSVITTNFMSYAMELWKDLKDFEFEFIIDSNSTLNIEVDLSEGFTLPLPDLKNCSLSVKTGTVSWALINNSIVFDSTESCNIDICLKVICECVGILNIKIKNTNCVSCDLISFEHLAFPLPVCPPYGQDTLPYIQWQYLFNTTTVNASPHKITNIEVEEWDLFENWSAGSSNRFIEVDTDDSTGTIQFYIHSFGPPMSMDLKPGDTVTRKIPVKICVYLEGIEEPCCNITEILFQIVSCIIIEDGGIVPNPVDVNSATIRYTLSYLPTEPLKITIADQQGIQRILVYDGIATSLTNSIPVNVSMLSAGIYFVVFEIDNQTLSLPFTMSFIKQ